MQVFRLRPDQIKMTLSCFVRCCSPVTVTSVIFLCQQIWSWKYKFCSNSAALCSTLRSLIPYATVVNV